MYKRKPNIKVFLIVIAVIICAGVIITVITMQKDKGLKDAAASRSSAEKSVEKTVSPQKTLKNSQGGDSKITLYNSAKALVPSQIGLDEAAKPFHITVSIENQNVTVYDANGKVVESFLCSTGSPGHDTPKGTFKVYNRGKSFYSKKYGEGGYYWVAFYEDYYFHSVPFDKDKKIIASVANDLGKQDSHGCVHLTIPDSEWIYKNIPNGTKVTVS